MVVAAGCWLAFMAYPSFATSHASLVTGLIIGFILWYVIRLGW